MNPLAERRQEEKERRRADILDAAEEVTRTVGWDELTMDQVARRVRLSRALLYVYFQDKSDLMFGICERGLVLLRQRFEQAAARHRTGLDQITAIGRAYIAFSQEFPVYFDIMARCELRERDMENPAANEAACMATGQSVHGLMVQVIQRGMTDGSIRSDLGSPMVAAMTLWGFVHGVIQLAHVKANLLAHHGVDGRALLEQSITMATRSLAAPG
ncbi:MAG: TetR/AcrR family transcriptional regulator [Proteobacteria bacterium]|nr:TetR/AcrR family transcriptional regulator [Pseudomonadota bacterium]